MGDLMRHLIAMTLAMALGAAPAYAALAVGQAAPDFKAPASMGGKVFDFSLASALKKGPVVLYFYPAAFTKGCTVEAHDFADAVDRFKAMNATVIGVSYDSIDTLNKFSVSECRSKFPVASDADQKIMKAYDAVLAKKPEWSDRTSYVISPEGKVIFTYTNLDPSNHVALTMQAVKDWHDTHKGKHHASAKQAAAQ